MQDGYDGFRAGFYGGDVGLEGEDVAFYGGGFAGGVEDFGLRVVGSCEDAARAGGLNVQACAEGALAGACEEDGPYGGVGGEAGKDAGDVLPHAFYESVEFGRAGDLHLGDIGGGEGYGEVVVGVAGCHGGGLY